MGVEIEGAGNQRVEARVGGFARSGDEIDAPQRAEFGSDKDRRAPLLLAFHETPFSADIFPGQPASDVKWIVSRFWL